VVVNVTYKNNRYQKNKIKTYVAEAFINLPHMVHPLFLMVRLEILMKIKKLLE